MTCGPSTITKRFCGSRASLQGNHGNPCPRSVLAEQDAAQRSIVDERGYGESWLTPGD